MTQKSLNAEEMDFIISALNFLFHRTVDRLQSGEPLGDIEKRHLISDKNRSHELIAKLLSSDTSQLKEKEDVEKLAEGYAKENYALLPGRYFYDGVYQGFIAGYNAAHRNQIN